MKNTIIISLLIISIVMIFLGVKANIIPPVLTGVGFILITILFVANNKKES